MKNNFKSQIMMLLILIVGVVGLTIGFASFSNSLLVSSSATVTPSGEGFQVLLSSSNTEELTTGIEPVVSGATADNAIIANGIEPSITGLKAYFTAPGQTATYTFYAHNAGQYDAYLKNINFKNVSGEESSKICVAGSETSDSLVQAACSSISVKIKVATDEEKSSTSEISNHPLLKNEYEAIVVKLEYAAGGNIADGDFSVSFGDIQLKYSSID